MSKPEPHHFRIELEDEEKKIEQAVQVKKCQECGKTFIIKSKNQVYCSYKCRFDFATKYMKEYMRDEMRNRRIAEYALKLSKEQIEKFDMLIEKQQFIEDIPAENHDRECFICKSTEKLIEHHINYVPEEKIILCKKCHLFLHNSLLSRRKCRPKKF